MSTVLTVAAVWAGLSVLTAAAIARIGYTLKKTRRSPR